MLILGVDTSGKNGSLALLRGEGAEVTTLDLVPLTGGSYSAQLVPQLAAMLQRKGVSKQQVDAYAVASGPGSFTGLRVGLSAVKAMAVALRKPIAAVSVLQAVASASPQPGRVLAALDDNRGHIYTGDYYVHGTNLPVAREEALLTMDEFLARAAGATVVCPDARLARALVGRGVRVEEIARPGADFIARLGYRKLLAGETATPETLDANYIRRSDAELFAKPF
ncbi:MAG TPA: tRNA (adenosine(37)-N6)-threonylcarbamoyltransferase complex dimerization subunit type 1 TsaB [Terriglobales bacterium]|nr:tRNA (adenosine(37)-N6)-threonylcarbamoyltransferase complex dimerization subunit type 1 TsaB [Terriglobales bacterium]